MNLDPKSEPVISRTGEVPAPVKTADGTRRFSSAALLGGAREVEIAHNGMVYRLRETSQGKLILTK
ncbi:hemin uptake protein HemP [Noviherbaspirillum cavernae]|uniref:Hemin uptake protein HemP n=1 Tax=Noviherbaspirillum cavernae TaxID=2320862 RepID=A0A418WWU0_9BURK|nr:hemin uptake protein HemP [Noviherbaspirillum cavernae]RJG04716.1 hemin uptake protein HemP [Noviherbaspirillum cavernae]